MAPERHGYEGHSIELRERKGKRELLIDGKAVRYGQLPGGRYYLHEYAYDWADDLLELVRRYIDYLRRTEAIRREPGSAQKGE